VGAMLDFLSLDAHAANQLVRQYRSQLQGAMLAPSTVGFLVAPVRGFTRYAKEKGLVRWRVTFSQQGQPRQVLSEVVPDVADSRRWPEGSLEAKVHDSLNLLLVGKSRNTWRCYSAAFKDWSLFIEKGTVDEGLAELLRGGKGYARRLVLGYQASMERRNMKPATIAMRTSALKSFAKLAYELEIVNWSLAALKAPRVETYADTRGPSLARIVEVVSMLARKDDPGSARNLAMIAMLYCHAFRINEALSLDLEHVDLAGSRAFVLEKGHRDRRWLGLSAEACERIRAWLRHRGPAPGPLFTGLRDGGRLAASSAWRITTAYGLGRPHGLRHAGITRVLDRNNGDVRKAQRFSRHKNLNMLLKYDDNREDLHAAAAADLADDLLSVEQLGAKGRAATQRGKKRGGA
jgi:integrase/recombinase XerC